MSESVVARARTDRGLLKRAFRALGHAANPFLLPIVGTGLVPLWGVVRHRGRSSGRMYDTPVAVLATADGFLIPLPFGPRTDWCRNLRTAGSGELRWKGRDYVIDAMAVVDASTLRDALGPILRVLVPAFGIRQFLRVRRSAS